MGDYRFVYYGDLPEIGKADLLHTVVRADPLPERDAARLADQLAPDFPAGGPAGAIALCPPGPRTEHRLTVRVPDGEELSGLLEAQLPLPAGHHVTWRSVRDVTPLPDGGNEYDVSVETLGPSAEPGRVAGWLFFRGGYLPAGPTGTTVP